MNKEADASATANAIDDNIIIDVEENEERLFKYFIVAGLNEREEQHEFPSQQSENRPTANDQKTPITDICVIFTSAGETTPQGFERIETTPSGYPANLSHGSLGSRAAFLCFRRGYHKPPLVEIGLLDESRGEKPMVDTIVLDKTPYGLSANISNSSQGLYFTSRRSKPDGPPHQLVVTDICVILENKGEHPPHTYFKIPKNLNRAMIGSEVFLCYKKSQMVCKRIAYKPAVLDCFPRASTLDDSILIQNVPKFFLPMGAAIEAWPERCRGTEKSAMSRTFSTCVFTDETYTKYYGASVTFYEPYTRPLSEYQMEKLDLGGQPSADEQQPQPSKLLSTSAAVTKSNDQKATLYMCNKAICILSRYPFFEPFRRFLYFLLNCTSLEQPSKVPIERYISHLLYEVPFPSPTRPRVLMELGTDMIVFGNNDSQTPLTGASFVETLKCLGTENFLYAMLLTLLEQKLLVHSLRPWLLVSVTETFCALIFPFSWQLPYIPQCPLEVADIFHAPLSFMAGVDSRYFDLKDDPPTDVTCFDLDTATVSQSAVRKLYSLSMLPKRPLKRLRATLEEIAKRVNDKAGKNQKDSEQTHQRKNQLELDIREAFLRFMCALMDGYADYLCPVMGCPRAMGATDVRRLFDKDMFLRSHDRNGADFYSRFCETTIFIRFIEERSGVVADRADGAVDRSPFYVFFDDCIARLRSEVFLDEKSNKNKFEANGFPSAERSAFHLLEENSMQANRTVVVQPPQLFNPACKEREFLYTNFPQRFEHDLFERQLIMEIAQKRPLGGRKQANQIPARNSYFILRTRQEIHKSLADAKMLCQQSAIHWPRTVLFYAYSLWFMQLPALLIVVKNKRKMLLLGMRVLSRMEQIGIPFHDQVCYRLLMHLCGLYGRPEMALFILRKLLWLGIGPNAITYKVYHQAIMQGEWPSPIRCSAIDAWRRLKIRIEICTRFRAHLRLFDQQSDDIDQSMHGDGNGSIVQELGILDMKEGELVDQNQQYQENEIEAHRDGDLAMDDPLGAANAGATIAVNEFANTAASNFAAKEILNCSATTPKKKTAAGFISSNNNSFVDKLLATNAAAAATTTKKHQTLPSSTQMLKSSNSFAAGQQGITMASNNNRENNPYMSPSREKFIREHSASPFAGDEGVRNMSNSSRGQSEKRKKKYYSRLGTSWLKSFASSSPLLNTLRSTATGSGGADSVDNSFGTDCESIAAASSSSPTPTVQNILKMDEMAFRIRSLVRECRTKAESLIFKRHPSTLALAQQNCVMMTHTARDLLSINYWMQDIIPDDDSELREVWLKKEQPAVDASMDSFTHEEFLDVVVCSCSPCSNCDAVIYDEEITVGWSVDDADLNSRCSHCQHSIVPALKVCIRERPQSAQQQDENGPAKEGKIVQAFTVPYISPLVLRRELERLISSEGPLILSRPLFRVSHPIYFWNIFYNCRRLELPSHFLTWVSPAVVIHCIQNMPILPTE